MKQRFLGALTPGAWIGLVVLVSIVGLAVFGPLFAPHPLDEPIGVPLTRTAQGRDSQTAPRTASTSSPRASAAIWPIRSAMSTPSYPSTATRSSRTPSASRTCTVGRTASGRSSTVMATASPPTRALPRHRQIRCCTRRPGPHAHLRWAPVVCRRRPQGTYPVWLLVPTS